MQRYKTFIEFYTFLDSDFSTLIENRNSSQCSQVVYAKSNLFKTAGNIDHAYLSLKMSSHDVICVLFVCYSWVGGH